MNRAYEMYSTDDAISAAHRFFESLMLRLISSDDARATLHFKYISPEWIGNPGWYFWPKSKMGVYLFRLETAAFLGDGVKATFQLYYYPHPQEEVFVCYSFEEQLVRVSEVFSDVKPENSCVCLCQHENEVRDFGDLNDGAGVPIPEVRDKLNSWLFHAGEIICKLDTNLIRECTVEAPYRSCTWAFQDVTVTDENGAAYPVLKRCEIDRNVPAWELCNEFVQDFLSGLHILGVSTSVEDERLEPDDCCFLKRTFRMGGGDLL